MKNFRKIPRGIDELLTSDGVKNHEVKIAEGAAEVTRRLASVLNEQHVKVVKTDKGVSVVVDSPYYHWDEWGNVKFRARAPLRRGLESTGLKIVSGP